MTTRESILARAGRRVLALATFALCGLAACSDGGGSSPRDAGADAATTRDLALPTGDAATEASGAFDARAVDAGSAVDLGIDGGTTAKPEAGIDVGADAPRLDVTPDVATLDLGPTDGPSREAAWFDGGMVFDVALQDSSLPSPDLPVAQDLAASEAALPQACLLSFTQGTANLVSAATPLATDCTAVQFGDVVAKTSQYNFGADDKVSGTMRAFNIDWFDTTTPAGTSLKVEDGYDISKTPWKGINVSYMESRSNGDVYSWTGDRGLVTLLSVNGKTFTVLLTSVHFSPMEDPFGQDKATGSFELNGTVTADLETVK